MIYYNIFSYIEYIFGPFYSDIFATLGDGPKVYHFSTIRGEKRNIFGQWRENEIAKAISAFSARIRTPKLVQRLGRVFKPHSGGKTPLSALRRLHRSKYWRYSFPPCLSNESKSAIFLFRGRFEDTP